MRWVQTLSWPGLDNYNSTDRQALVNPDTELTEAFVKAHDRLKFYWILGAGHSVGGLSMLSYAICQSCSIVGLVVLRHEASRGLFATAELLVIARQCAGG